MVGCDTVTTNEIKGFVLHKYFNYVLLLSMAMAVTSLAKAGDLTIDQDSENSTIVTEIANESDSFDITIDQSGESNQLAISVDSHIAATIDQIGTHGLIDLASSGSNQQLSLSQEGVDNQNRASYT